MADLLTEQQVLNAVYDPTTGMLKVNVAGMTFEGEVNVDDVLISNPVGNPVNVKLPEGAQAVLDTNSGDIKTAAQAISAILATVIGEDKTLPVSGTVSETNSAAIKTAAEAVQAAVEDLFSVNRPLTKLKDYSGSTDATPGEATEIEFDFGEQTPAHTPLKIILVNKDDTETLQVSLDGTDYIDMAPNTPLAALELVALVESIWVKSTAASVPYTCIAGYGVDGGA